MARKYEKVKGLLSHIQKMQEKGYTQREIADYYGLSDRSVVKELLKRERRKQRREPRVPKKRGRKPAVTLQQYKYENKRLKMENELLRDFLESMKGSES